MKRATRTALSLVEVVVAMVVLGLAIPPLVIQIGASARARVVTTSEQNAAQLASDRLGEIFADQVNPTRGYAYVQTSAYPVETAPCGFTGYTRTTEVREVSATDFVSPLANSGIKRIRVTVAAPDNTSIKLESFVCDLGS